MGIYVKTRQRYFTAEHALIDSPTHSIHDKEAKRGASPSHSPETHSPSKYIFPALHPLVAVKQIQDETDMEACKKLYFVYDYVLAPVLWHSFSACSLKSPCDVEKVYKVAYQLCISGTPIAWSETGVFFNSEFPTSLLPREKVHIRIFSEEGFDPLCSPLLGVTCHRYVKGAKSKCVSIMEYGQMLPLLTSCWKTTPEGVMGTLIPLKGGPELHSSIYISCGRGEMDHFNLDISKGIIQCIHKKLVGF